MQWPFNNELYQKETIKTDVVVLGGGISGCFAAIAAARQGKKVVLIEKGTIIHSGAMGSGVDHWESACTNPCSKVSADEITNAYIDEQDHYSNGIAHYIECFEGYDRLLDMEEFGAKIRDTQDEFKGAPFRDDKTKLMFAYDYENKFTIRIWGTTFKPALYKELKRLNITLYERYEATSLLTKDNKGVGAMAFNSHTGKILVVNAKATILAMSRPARIWLFNPDMVGLSEFRPTQCIGSGHAMGLRAGVSFTLMEKSVRAEFSAAGRSFPPYSTGNNHNTWYAATMVDANGKEIPYVDRDGNILSDVLSRYYPAKGQKFFLKGGVIDNPKYEYRGPETLPFEQLIKLGYKLPFYADLSKMPWYERKVIWGMMVGQEGKTKIPVYKNLNDQGFDPLTCRLQSYGTGWQSANFLDQERQLFGAPGGIITDWNLKTNIDGIYACGDSLYAMDCAGAAAATGYYAGRKAAKASEQVNFIEPDINFINNEIQRLYAPLSDNNDMDWRELNMAISKCMQNYCGGIKNDELLLQGIDLLNNYKDIYLPKLHGDNPHELMRCHEVSDILDVSLMILHACYFRKTSSTPLNFQRSDTDIKDNKQDQRYITIYKENNQFKQGSIPLDYYGDVKENYEKNNQDYLKEQHHGSI